MKNAASDNWHIRNVGWGKGNRKNGVDNFYTLIFWRDVGQRKGQRLEKGRLTSKRMVKWGKVIGQKSLELWTKVSPVV